MTLECECELLRKSCVLCLPSTQLSSSAAIKLRVARRNPQFSASSRASLISLTTRKDTRLTLTLPCLSLAKHKPAPRPRSQRQLKLPAASSSSSSNSKFANNKHKHKYISIQFQLPTDKPFDCRVQVLQSDWPHEARLLKSLVDNLGTHTTVCWQNETRAPRLPNLEQQNVARDLLARYWL